MLKLKIKKLIKKILLLLLFSLVYMGIGFIVAILISNRFDYNLQDVMTYEGFILILIGIALSMKGNPSGMNLNGIGQSDDNALSYLNYEVTRQDRESNPNYKDYFKSNVVVFAFSNLTFILGGIFIIILAAKFF